jgi:phenylalanyl-tRNA synthetase beta subunit
VRKTAKRHQLNTDAFRFERGIDPITAYALKRAALLIQAMKQSPQEIVDIYNKKVEDFSVF